MKDLKDYLDEKGFIVHNEPDMASGRGDSSQRMGMFYLFTHYTKEEIVYIRARLRHVWFLLNKYYNEPVRHWNPYIWPGQKGIMSRDNLIPLICCFAVFGLYKELFTLLFRILTRGGFLWNTKKIGQQNDAWKVPDWCGPSMWLLAFRSLPIVGWIFSPIADGYFYLQLKNRFNHAMKNGDDVGDDLNLVCLLESYRRLRPTKLTTKLLLMYRYERPPAMGDVDLGLFQALKWYFRDVSAPPIDESVIQAIKLRWPKTEKA